MKTILKKIQHLVKSFFSYIWTHKKKPKVFIPLVIVIIALIFIGHKNNQETNFGLYTVSSQEFIQEVTVTGKVTPAQKVDMSFEVSGKIKNIKAIVGTQVKAGEVLAELSNLDYIASVNKNQATYLSEQAKLANLQNGSRPEELRIAISNVETAQQNLEQSKSDVVEGIKDAFATVDDAVKNKVDTVFRYPQSTHPELVFFVDGNTSLKNQVEFERLRIYEIYPEWITLIQSISSSGSITDAQINTIKNNLQYVQSFLNDLNIAVANIGEGVRDEDQSVQYRSDISTARQSVNTAIQTLNTTISTYRNNQSALVRVEEQLKLAQQGSTAEEITAQRAQTQGAAAGVSSATASLNKTRLIAPFDGIITRVAYKTGESVSQTDAVITLMSNSAFEVETFVSENDAPKLKVGQPAKVTLDALGDSIVFDAVVNQVDLSETIKDGVVTYKTRLQFVSQDERIKSGLTANVTVESDRRPETLKVPQSAIVLQKGKKYVKQVPVSAETWSPLVDKNAKLVLVTTGGIDRDGDIEIVQGLQAGDKVIIRTNN